VSARPAGAKPPLLVLVIGETARADHFSLNGYQRPTNPELATRQLLSFTEVSSCGTSTAASLPCMFSHLGRKGYDGRAREHENLLDLLQHAGLAVLWLDNQAGCKGLCARVPQANANSPASGDARLLAGLCDGEECLDEALLRGIDQRLAALPAERRAQGIVLVMHQMGSHGPAYYKRSPADRKPFQPECTTNVLQQCAREAVVNAYDNSIVYTDHVLSQAIGWLQDQAGAYDASLLYVSDHGESLGENNLFLHGLPYAVAPREQTHVPMLLWLPSQRSAQLACLRARRDAALSHDNLFHTVLGLVGVTAAEYQPALDLMAACKDH
jgi:lipid A ethanolaminephosphotransferase